MEDERKNEDEFFADEEHLIEEGLSDPGTDVGNNQGSKPCPKTEDAETVAEAESSENIGLSEAETPCIPGDDISSESTDHLMRIEKKLEEITGNEQRLFYEVREMHKLYHSEFAGRLMSMQNELDQYRKIDRGRAFDDILSSIARIYVNNETLADEISEPKAQKSIRYMLLDIEELLAVYGMMKLRSSPGDKRNPRHCQVRNRILTDDPAKHDTVAKSYNAGFYIENRTIIKEVVDIFVYERKISLDESEEDRTIETGDTPVEE